MTFIAKLSASMKFPLAAMLAGALLGAPAQAEDKSYILTTATTGGTYYPVGVAIATP